MMSVIYFSSSVVYIKEQSTQANKLFLRNNILYTTLDVLISTFKTSFFTTTKLF